MSTIRASGPNAKEQPPTAVPSRGVDPLAVPQLFRQLGYVKVDQPDGAPDKLLEQKSSPDAWRAKDTIPAEVKSVPPGGSRALLALKKAMAGGRGKGAVKVRLVYNFSQSSAANTALSAALGLDVLLATDFSGFASLYDEARIDAVEAYVTYFASATPVNNGCWAVTCFDPENGTAPSGINDVLANQKHSKPVCISTGVAGQLVQESVGRWHSGTLARGTEVGTLGSSDIVAGSWFPTATSHALAGYQVTYIPSGGAGVSVGYNSIVIFHVTFRMRT